MTAIGAAMSGIGAMGHARQAQAAAKKGDMKTAASEAMKAAGGAVKAWQKAPPWMKAAAMKHMQKKIGALGATA